MFGTRHLRELTWHAFSMLFQICHGDTRRITPDHKTGKPVYRLATDLEARYVRASATIRLGDIPMPGSYTWGCCHCSKHYDCPSTGDRRHVQSWMNKTKMKNHLRDSYVPCNSCQDSLAYSTCFSGMIFMTSWREVATSIAGGTRRGGSNISCTRSGSLRLSFSYSARFRLCVFRTFRSPSLRNKSS